MSAVRIYDIIIKCDHPFCPMSVTASSFSKEDPTAGHARRIIRNRGWVHVKPGQLDFCPEHAEDGNIRS